VHEQLPILFDLGGESRPFMVVQQDGLPPPPGGLLCGTVPPLADAYVPRAESGPDLARNLSAGRAAVLVPGEETDSASAAQGGTGKTQLAVAFARAMWTDPAVEAVIWVNAASRESVLTGFAQAANTVDAGQPDEDAGASAARFVSWLAHTRRPWALVLDDLAEVTDLAELWPGGPSGRVVITTRLPAGAFGGPDITVIPVPGLSRREALSYLTARLTDHPDQRIEALDLGQDLDGLPLGLAQATAVMRARGQGCREYRAQLAERRGHMPAIPGVSEAVLATWSIAAECAHELPPAGLAWPTLVLVALLDHHGIPGTVLITPAACGYIAGRPSSATGPDQDMVAAAISNLTQAGLVTLDQASGVRTVLTHASVQAAVRTYLPQADLEQGVLAAADALLQAWPDDDPGASGGTGARGPQVGQGQPGQSQLGQGRTAGDAERSRRGGQVPAGEPGRDELEQAMRDCAAVLRGADDGALWRPAAHPLLFRVGLSLDRGRLAEPAIAYWKSMMSSSTRRLGPSHQNTVLARDRLAAAYEAAGRYAEAIAVFSAALADWERNCGPEHIETIAARSRLAHSYHSAARPAEAVTLYERTVADAGHTLGPVHPVTLEARTNLAQAYLAAGKPREAIAAHVLLLGDAERQLGTGHPATIGTRTRLGAAYAANGQLKEAITQYDKAVSDTDRMRGPDHLDTIAARASLASALRTAGQGKDAIAQYERVLADRERVQGADHRDAIAARANLAYAYRSAGRLKEAIPQYERTLADRARVQGPDHRDTLTARSNLAACYQQARRLTDAVPQYERAVADSERMLGPGDIETLTTRCNLATVYYTAGRLNDVVLVLQRALSDCEKYLGPEHQMTQTVRENLDAATQA
jgi:tetratricopeptide (TPR) repeat protein